MNYFPAGLPDILAVLMLVAAAVSAANLAAALSPASWLSTAEPAGARSLPRSSRGADIDIAYLLMGIAMAGMLAPNVSTLPSPAWEIVFGLLTAWFAWHLADRAKRDSPWSLVSGHGAAHLFHCAAMVYMYAVLAAPGICTIRGGKFPTLAQVFGLVLACYSVRDLMGQLPGRRHDRGAAPVDGGTPTTVCRIFMGVTTASMLLFAG